MSMSPENQALFDRIAANADQDDFGRRILSDELLNELLDAARLEGPAASRAPQSLADLVPGPDEVISCPQPEPWRQERK